jgi:hypothetical protein
VKHCDVDSACRCERQKLRAQREDADWTHGHVHSDDTTAGSNAAIPTLTLTMIMMRIASDEKNTYGQQS